MPWLKMPKPKSRHQCKTPRWIFWWRKDRDLWGCPRCGYIYKLVKPDYGKEHYSWLLEDSRGFKSPSWNGRRPVGTYPSRADEKKMSMDEWAKRVEKHDFDS